MTGSLLHSAKYLGPNASKHELFMTIQYLEELRQQKDMQEQLEVELFRFRDLVLERVAAHKRDEGEKKPHVLEIPLPWCKDDKGVKVPVKLEIVSRSACYDTLLADVREQTGYHFIYRNRDQRVAQISTIVQGAMLLASADPLDKA